MKRLIFSAFLIMLACVIKADEIVQVPVYISSFNKKANNGHIRHAPVRTWLPIVETDGNYIYKGEILVICEFLKGITNIDAEDIDSYSTKVLNLIDLSQLSGTVRQNLRNGVIVGKASKKLWKLTPIDQLPVKEER